MINSDEAAHPVRATVARSRGTMKYSGSLTLILTTAYFFLAAGLLTASVLLGAGAQPEPRPGGPLPTVVGLLALLIGVWSMLALRGRIERYALAAFAVSLSLAAGLFPDAIAARSLAPAWIVGSALAAAALLDLALLYPSRSTLTETFPFIRWTFYLGGMAAAVFGAARYIVAPSPGRAIPFLWLLLLAAAVFFIKVGLAAFSAPALVDRTRARLAAAATAVSFSPLAVWSTVTGGGPSAVGALLLLPALILPLTLLYGMRGFSMAGTARWLRQGAIHGLASMLILAAYALVVAGLSIIIGAAAPTLHPIWVGGFALLFAILLQPVRVRVQAMADRTFLRGQRAIDDAVKDFTRQFSGALDINEIGRIVRGAITSTVRATAVHIFHYDELNDQFVALPDPSGRASSDVRFPGGGALAEQFAQQSLPLQVDERSLPETLITEKSRLAILGARLLLPLPGKERARGWIALGPPQSGRAYSSNETLILEQLAGQASLAIRRIETVAQLERRLREMNAITRVAQGVNITLTYDDVLELIYAQIAQIVPFSHFRITLSRPDEELFYLALVVVDNERLTSLENAPLPPNVGLAREVIRRGRPIITTDYQSECRTLGVEPTSKDISAWMGVPLNAGAQSIGALTVGSREPGVAYTPAQLDLLYAVADQTAGAIVKARLLQETQQRAAQLSKLNEVARQLASIRDLTALRQGTLDGAVEILGCEAGVFYSVDPPTGDLVIGAVNGSVSPAMLGETTRAGSGPAHRAIADRAAVIENDLEPGSGKHFLDRNGSGVTPRSSLTAPLVVQDTIIGVMEFLNRRDSRPFVLEDQALLLAFAGQAAAALENLRLYTLTDQELAARVEELSVMQRIDRELNASLEMDRAMRITLEWALRQSGADAGFIGLLEGGALRIVTELGYGRPIGNPKDQTVPLSLPGFQAAIEAGLPQRVRFEPGGGGFLPAADHQVVVPIRREANVIGLLILESLGASQEDIGFLSRLSDHAAIAISNAQLYDEVQRANIAKSDFVSLVAHELKNPMTSIKGYTELLAAGAVGEVNEMQAGFLNTIRSNTERMSTLVSDLNDNSKIEAGRLRLDFRAVDLAELIDETIASTKRQIEERKQVVQLDLRGQLPSVWSDRTRLAQVLVNLVSNAHKYTPEGGTLIMGAEAAPNRWDPEGAGTVVHVWVQDNGIGISPEDQERIFQKFFRSEDPKAREVPGAGLGLNITRSLVEMQGGRIWFESEYRAGTTFHFTVPVAEA